MHKYKLLGKKGEGTFSEVLKAQVVKSGKLVAIKRMKNQFDSLEQVNNLREIQALRRLSPHPNIINLLEVLYDRQTGRLALVFELMDMNVYEVIRASRTNIPEPKIKMFMFQLIRSMDHMHKNGIFHRDIKPENILIVEDKLKLADFGSCRGIYSKQPYTEYISTRWYRAPECLLTDGYYNYKMDMWGIGCVFFETMTRFPLFPGQNEIDQIKRIHDIIGTPPPELLERMRKHSTGGHMNFNFPAREGTGVAELLPNASAECVDVITKLLAYNPDDRLSARQALRHPYFRELREAEKRQQGGKSKAASDLPNINKGEEKKPEWRTARPESQATETTVTTTVSERKTKESFPTLDDLHGGKQGKHAEKKLEDKILLNPVKEKKKKIGYEHHHHHHRHHHTTGAHNSKEGTLPPLQKANQQKLRATVGHTGHTNNGVTRNNLDPFGMGKAATYQPRDYYKPKIKPKRNNFHGGGEKPSYSSPYGKAGYGRR